MATAIYHSDRGTKSALIFVKNHALELRSTPCYVHREGLPAGIQEGESFLIPDNFFLVPMRDKDGTPRTTEPDKDGKVEVLLELTFNNPDA